MSDMLLDGSSLEMTAKDVSGLVAARALIRPGSHVNITFLGNETVDMRVAAATAVAECGFVPVPHISARRLRSTDELVEFLDRLRDVDAATKVFVVGGDPSTPHGPFDSALDIIETGLLPAHGTTSVAISGYPEGHPDIPREVLREHLVRKCRTLSSQGIRPEIITQFGFDVAPVMQWIADVRDEGIEAGIRIGVPGPAKVRQLLKFAGRFGIGANAMILKKYGLSLSNMIGATGPDLFVAELAAQLGDDSRMGSVGLHFYTFGGLEDTASWIHTYRQGLVK